MTRRWSVAAVLAAFALSMAFDVAVAQQKWKGVATSRPTPQFSVWEWFASELPKRTDGKITGEVVSLPELGLTGFELIRVTKAGLVDFADIILAYMAGEVPALEAVDLPAIYPDFAASIKAHDAFIEAVPKTSVCTTSRFARQTIFTTRTAAWRCGSTPTPFVRSRSS